MSLQAQAKLLEDFLVHELLPVPDRVSEHGLHLAMDLGHLASRPFVLSLSLFLSRCLCLQLLSCC